MGSITVRLVCRMLALTKGHLPFFGQYKFDGREFTALMRTVAKRLVLREAAAAPPISPWFEFKNSRLFKGNCGFGHVDTSLLVKIKRILLNSRIQSVFKTRAVYPESDLPFSLRQCLSSSIFQTTRFQRGLIFLKETDPLAKYGHPRSVDRPD